MSRRFRLSARTLGAAIAAVVLVLPLVTVMAQAQTGAAKGSTPSRTPWGHPNLQGVWTSDTVMGVPFERARTEPLTAEEKVNQQKLQALEKELDPRGSNIVWNERALSTKITRPESLVVDPPDGRVPNTPEVKALIGDYARDVRR